MPTLTDLIRTGRALVEGVAPTIELSSDDLELYHEPGHKAAATKISAALTAAAKELVATLETPEYASYNEEAAGRALAAVFKKYVTPVIDKYRKSHGAADSEPYYTMQRALIRVVKQHYGLQGGMTGTRLADYF